MSSEKPASSKPSGKGVAEDRLYDRIKNRSSGKLVLKKGGIDKKKKSKSNNPNELKINQESATDVLDKREKLKSDKFCK
jgi:hypothetical protein